MQSFFALWTALFFCCVSCSSSDVLSSRCKSCGTVQEYAPTFDELDYALIRDVCAEFSIERDVYWRAPNGPSPGCSSTYEADLSWDYLYEEMPQLKRDTFDSFQARNRATPTHHGLKKVAAKYGIKLTRWREGS